MEARAEMPRLKSVDPFSIETKDIVSLARTKFEKTEREERERLAKSRKAFTRVDKLIKEFRDEIAVAEKLEVEAEERGLESGERHWESSDLEQPIEGIKASFKKKSQKIERAWKKKAKALNKAAKEEQEAQRPKIRAKRPVSVRTSASKPFRITRPAGAKTPRDPFTVSGRHIGAETGGVREDGLDEVGSPGVPQRTKHASSTDWSGAHFKVLYPYRKEQEGDLELDTNDIVHVMPEKKRADGWWFGYNTRTAKSGMFPGNFCDSVDLSQKQVEELCRINEQEKASPSPKAEPALSESTGVANLGEHFRACHEFQGEQEGDLALQEGDVLHVMPQDQHKGGWWLGINLRSMAHGTFPATFCEPMNLDDAAFRNKLAPKSPAPIRPVGSPARRALESPRVQAGTVNSIHFTTLAAEKTASEAVEDAVSKLPKVQVAHFQEQNSGSNRNEDLDEILGALSPMQMEMAALKLQSHYRRFSSSKRVLVIKVQKKERDNAAGRIQQQFRKQSSKRNKAASTIQKQLKKKKQKEREHNAARTIQNRFRNSFSGQSTGSSASSVSTRDSSSDSSVSAMDCDASTRASNADNSSQPRLSGKNKRLSLIPLACDDRSETERDIDLVIWETACFTAAEAINEALSRCKPN